jgi:apolipoprotein D and lipocalin family protein
MSMKIRVLLLSLCLGFSVRAEASIHTVAQVDLGEYAGTWYEIARNPIIFEPSCACARQVLTPAANGAIDVYNSCDNHRVGGKLVEIRGTAKSADSTGARLEVSFGFPWKGDYWVIALDSQYRYAVVTDRFGYSLYILSRTPELDPALHEEALQAAKRQVSIKRLKTTPQDGCTYPSADE